MKPTPLILILTATALSSTLSFAQNIQLPLTETNSPHSSVPAKKEITVRPILKSRSNPQFPFQNQLRTRPAEPTVIEEPASDPSQRYKMPIAKPGKTSKILVAKLDPDSPYHYNMPVLKDRKKEE